MVVTALMLISQPAIADDLADLKAAHNMMQKALFTGDIETAFGYFHEGFVYIPATRSLPRVMNLAREKPHWIKWWETHIYRSRWYKTEFRVIGNTGLVWGVREVTVINKKSGSRKKQFQIASSTWVKSDGKWKTVLGQYAPIPPAQTLD
jgi:hypothetical protein